MSIMNGSLRLPDMVPATRPRSVPGVGCVAALLLCSAPLEAQTIQGRVLEAVDQAPVATALVRLVDEDGEVRRLSAADSVGGFSLTAPAPGTYRLEVERIGFEPFETPLLEVPNPDGVYPIELLLERSPVPIRGLEVTAEMVDGRLQAMTGRDPRSLRWEPFYREALIDHVERAHDLTDMMRWSNLPGIEVFEYRDGPCYLMRRHDLCLPVYLNGVELIPEIFDNLPLDMLETVAVLSPTESVLYPSGGILLYTDAWIR